MYNESENNAVVESVQESTPRLETNQTPQPEVKKVAKTTDPRILSVGTALPAYKVQQHDIQELTHSLFAQTRPDIDRLIKVFDNGLVQSRYFCTPLEWFQTDHSFAEKNALYIQNAIELGESAARSALSRAKLEAHQIDAIIFVSTTGIATPSLDVALIKRLNLSRHVARIPIWGLGCAGGAAGIARAADYARAHPGSRVLLIAVELCSLTFQRGDLSKSNLIATSLFADGAAAVVVGSSEVSDQGPSLIGNYSTLIEDSEDVMGWDVIESGLKVRFAKSVPELVRSLMFENLTAASNANGIKLEQLEHFVTHPGGLKVLQAYEGALGLKADSLHDSYEVLKNYGNMSSVSVLFVLERFMDRWAKLKPNVLGAISSMGPGFSAEHVLFRT
jgi:alkylresorcinol/alkylpyrone synthase